VLQAIWTRHRSEVLARLDAIERAVASDADPGLRADGWRAAHQLAGTLGTFGFTRGTELARQLEAHLGERQAVPPDPCAPDLRTLACDLRCELDGSA
jgi:HPt (histidine-containing phosphotransfer) domain-containing protein